jgi:hypothetical protein
MRIPVTALSWASPALALALGAAVQAHEPEKGTTPQATAPSGATAPVRTAESMVVVRDKETGRLRRATPEEVEKLHASGRNAPVARAPVEPYEVRSRIPGSRAMAMGDAGMSYSVVRRNAQGGLDEACVTGDEAVAKFMAGAAKKEKAHE